eukprot:CAMPEP_0177714732 /NCGR_PEP_ID=MMETSP0484_2-20121128/13609_1 /TAXON_ID=354590 /ORGANISM="Rhodomonas lens, Strain RHODO" /LENGTH=229 /DNA_ID=CAMNT_0019226667 /DNA_START=23 /DNA_END=709 /DNA_ORIENTATION=-
MAEVELLLTNYDLKRLEAYARNIVDHHIIVDLIPVLARLYFMNRLPVPLSFTQAAGLLGVGLQHRSIDSLAAALKLEPRQLLANLNKAIVRMSKLLRSLREQQAEAVLPTKRRVEAEPLGRTLASHLTQGAKQAGQAQRDAAEARVAGSKGGALEEGEAMEEEYAVAGDESAWEAALEGRQGAIPASISLPSSKKKRLLDSEPAYKDPREAEPPGERRRSGGKGKGGGG